MLNNLSCMVMLYRSTAARLNDSYFDKQFSYKDLIIKGSSHFPPQNWCRFQVSKDSKRLAR